MCSQNRDLPATRSDDTEAQLVWRPEGNRHGRILNIIIAEDRPDYTFKFQGVGRRVVSDNHLFCKTPGIRANAYPYRKVETRSQTRSVSRKCQRERITMLSANSFMVVLPRRTSVSFGSMRVQIGDVRLFFDVDGSKLRPDGSAMREVPTLLLLHGGPGFDHSGFKPDFVQLTDVVQIIYLDQRGCGRSDRGPINSWKLDQWATDIRSFCDALNIQQPIVMGQSFGGCVALAYAIRYPDHPSKLIVSSALVQPVGARSFGIFERLGGRAARDAAVAFWTNPGPNTRKDYFAHCMPLYTRRPMPPEFVARSVRNPEVADFFFSGELKTLNLLPQLSSIRCPTLVTGGEDDPVTTINDAEDIAAAIPGNLVRFERFAGAGHGVYRDRPEEFFRILREFMIS